MKTLFPIKFEKAGYSKEWHKVVYGGTPRNDEEVLIWQELRRSIIRRDKHKCQRCQRREGLTVHHIIPRSEDGTDIPSNLITLCGRCHDTIEQTNFRNKAEIIGKDIPENIYDFGLLVKDSQEPYGSRF